MSIVYLLVYSIWFGAELWIGLRERGKTTTADDRHTKKIFVMCAAAAIVVAWIGPQPPQYTIFWMHDLMKFLGSLIMLVGIILRVFSVFTLGDYFRTTVMVQKGQKVIAVGPYKYIRHPSYLGFLITLAGLGVFFNNWLSLSVILVIGFIGVSNRIKVEEEVLSKELGKDYVQYRRHTHKLIPHIY